MEKPNKSLAKQSNEIIRFIIPDDKHEMTYEEGMLRRCFYRHHSCPGFLLMREEFGLIPDDCSFNLYIFRVLDNELLVVSCTRYSSTGTTKSDSGYTYIRLPSVTGHPEEWEYHVSDQIKVLCRSERSVVTIDGISAEMLEVRRNLYYSGNSRIDSTTEYYLEGTGSRKMRYRQCNFYHGKLQNP